MIEIDDPDRRKRIAGAAGRHRGDRLHPSVRRDRARAAGSRPGPHHRRGQGVLRAIRALRLYPGADRPFPHAGAPRWCWAWGTRITARWRWSPEAIRRGNWRRISTDTGPSRRGLAAAAPGPFLWPQPSIQSIEPPKTIHWTPQPGRHIWDAAQQGRPAILLPLPTDRQTRGDFLNADRWRQVSVLRPHRRKAGPEGLAGPGKSFTEITSASDAGKWKIVFFWPKDFTFICPTEIAAFGKLAGEFADRDAVVWRVHRQRVRAPELARAQRRHPEPRDPDARRPEARALEALGILDKEAGVALRATFIVDPDGASSGPRSTA